MKRLIIILILVNMLLVPIVYSKEGHLTLLAVKETEDGFEGSTADMYLEIQPGEGRVFLDTFPLTKVDTQISTRFAKEVACNFLNRDCSEQDFIFTIKAESAIIAGPSAGAAAAVLTAILLEDLKPNESISITGTINSGGLIGNVGGIKEKIEAGTDAGLKKILIPKGEKIATNITQSSEKLGWEIVNDTLTIEITNKTKNIEKKINVTAYSKENVDIKEVSTLNDAIFEFTGKRFEEDGQELPVDNEYAKIMKSPSLDLCNRSDKLKKDIEKIGLSEDYSDIKKEAINLSKKGMIAFEQESFYSSASYCFGANVKYSLLYMAAKNFSQDDMVKAIKVVREGMDNLDNSIASKKILTLTDLESYAAVKERLLDAEYYIGLTIENINESNISLYNLAYASERVYSAFSWYNFFKHIGKEFDLDKEKIKLSCQNKISEAEERYQYVRLLFPTFLEDTKKEIDYAYSYLSSDEYELCLFKASTAKAEADIILNLMGLEENQTKEILDIKLDIVKKSMIRQNNIGIFPIMAYSYYEYANSLKESDLYSSLLYAEYALELSNFEMYFKDNKEIHKKIIEKIDPKLPLFMIGICIGIMPYLILINKNKKRKINKK